MYDHLFLFGYEVIDCKQDTSMVILSPHEKNERFRYYSNWYLYLFITVGVSAGYLIMENNINHKLTWKRCLYKVIASGPFIFILTFLYGVMITAIFSADSFKGSGHANAWPYLFLGSISITVFFTFINLIYLIPTDNLKLKFLSPGLIGVVLFGMMLVAGQDQATSGFFLGAGVINLVVGFYHYKRAERYSSR